MMHETEHTLTFDGIQEGEINLDNLIKLDGLDPMIIYIFGTSPQTFSQSTAGAVSALAADDSEWKPLYEIVIDGCCTDPSPEVPPSKKPKSKKRKGDKGGKRRSKQQPSDIGDRCSPQVSE